MSAEHDRINRQTFEESIEVIKSAWTNERFSYRGKQFVFPPDEIPDRGKYVDDLTLIPRPLRTVDVYQPVTSPETIEYVPRAGHKAVYWLQNADSQKQKWDRYAEIREEMGDPVAPGEDRCLVLNLHVGRTREAAMRRGRPGQLEQRELSLAGQRLGRRGGTGRPAGRTRAPAPRAQAGAWVRWAAAMMSRTAWLSPSRRSSIGSGSPLTIDSKKALRSW